jgi:hypothetical protein
MSWETRRGGKRYYTRSRRVAGRVVREYVGTGGRAEEAAAADEARRRQWLSERDTLCALDALLDQFHTLADLLVEATLLAAGYHRHNRGQWRKRRAPTTPPQQLPAPADSVGSVPK